jgi:Ca-activated chloride channel family protein
MPEKADYYLLLGLPRDAPPDDIRRAYFDAARRLHPDKNIAPGETEFFLEIQEAYEVLSDQGKRARYDASLSPEKPPSLPVQQTVVYSRQSITEFDEPQLIYVLLEYAPLSDPNAVSTPPLNLCLILDRSTSMQGAHMDIVKATAIQILHRLRPQDALSVVAFSDRAEAIIPSARNADLTKLETRIQMLQTSGGTEIFRGLEAGYNEVRRNLDKAHVNHIILLTDGRTYGDEAKCLELAEKAAGQGIGISGLGIGHEWNDVFLDELAARTGGSSMYVSRPQDIQRLLLEKFNHLGRTPVCIPVATRSRASSSGKPSSPGTDPPEQPAKGPDGIPDPARILSGRDGCPFGRACEYIHLDTSYPASTNPPAPGSTDHPH